MDKDKWILSFLMDGFLKVEERLKSWYGIDRNTIMPYLLKAATEALYESKAKEKYKINGVYSVNAYMEEHIRDLRVTLSSAVYDENLIDSFCKDHELGLSKEDDEFEILELACFLLECCRSKDETIDDVYNYEYREYIHAVRPDMLKLYIGLHAKNSPKASSRQYHKQCRISFGDLSPIKIDGQTPWFQEALDRYLEKYLGVVSVKEAEHELNSVYGEKVGAKMNTTAVRYMWGTYHLLQSIPKFNSKNEKSVSRKQARIITDLLNRLGLIRYKPKESFLDYQDGERIRPLLKYYLTYYNSLDEVIESRQYKTSPNNKDGFRYF